MPDFFPAADERQRTISSSSLLVNLTRSCGVSFWIAVLNCGFKTCDTAGRFWQAGRMTSSPARFRAPFFFALIWLLVLAGLNCPAQSPVSVVLDPQNPGAEIPSDFVGLSFEMQRVLADTNGNHFFNATNQALIATFKTLGIKNLRVGGNTADRRFFM